MIKKIFLVTVLTLKSLLIGGFPIAVSADENDNAPQINTSDVPWAAIGKDYAGEDFTQAFRYKMLIGAYAQVKAPNVFFGEAEFAPGAIYVGHSHPAPEIYYVISGEAEWTVDGHTFKATPGTAIYTRPNGVHRMVNTGDEVLKTVWMWWGNSRVLDQPSKVVEPLEKQPPGAVFTD